jgi:hypothetical protein
MSKMGIRRPVHSFARAAALLAAGAILAQGCASGNAGGGHDSAHYVESGFFDIHVCHWPDQPLFLMALFSTTRFGELQQVEVLGPAGEPLGTLDLTRFRLGHKAGEPEKRVFIRNIPVGAAAKEGWYHARVTLRDGRVEEARDFVVLRSLPIATGMKPAANAENIPLPAELTWNPIPGAKYYQVFVKDLWDGEKLILTSKLLSEPRLALPKGVLQPGGLYAWRIHARDVNEDPTFGDFNDGSLSPEITFSVAP